MFKKALLILICSNHLLFSQEFLSTERPIITADCLTDSTEYVFGSTSKIYLVDPVNFKLKDSIVMPFSSYALVDKIEKLKSDFNVLKVKSRAGIFGKPDFMEFPLDSTYFLDLTKKEILFSLPGNITTDFSEEKDTFLTAINGFFSYQNKQGDSNFAPSGKSVIGFMPIKKEIELAATTRAIKFYPNNKDFLLVVYDSLSSGRYYYTLQKRTLPDFELVTSRVIVDKPEKINFSEDGKYIVVEKINPSDSHLNQQNN